MIERFHVYVMKDIGPVEIVVFDTRKIPNDTQDRPTTDRLEAVLGDLYSLTVTNSVDVTAARDPGPGNGHSI